MAKGNLGKVQRLEKFYPVIKTAAGKRRYGPYWRGVWLEKGEERRVYLGKEVPKSLQYLLDERYKKRGFRNYTWPERAKKGGD